LYIATVVKTFMSTTFTIRIPQELKEKMEKNPAEWSREVRCFLEERIKQIELMKTLQEIEQRAEKRKTKTDSTLLIREDRERRA
jgi:predicted transcriptional regulator